MSPCFAFGLSLLCIDSYGFTRYFLKNIIIQQSYADLVAANSPRTSLLAAVSQQHAEIMAGCRVLTEDDGILRALIDAANSATTEAFHLIYAERPEIAAPIDSKKPAKKSAAASGQSPPKKPRRSVKKPPEKP